MAESLAFGPVVCIHANKKGEKNFSQSSSDSCYLGISKNDLINLINKKLYDGYKTKIVCQDNQDGRTICDNLVKHIAQIDVSYSNDLSISSPIPFLMDTHNWAFPKDYTHDESL